MFFNCFYTFHAFILSNSDIFVEYGEGYKGGVRVHESYSHVTRNSNYRGFRDILNTTGGCLDAINLNQIMTNWYIKNDH